MGDAEKEIIRNLYDYPACVRQAAEEFSPALIANYSYELAKSYNRFYQDCSILREPDADKRQLRLAVSAFTADVIRRAMELLGIRVPDRM